jgi:hypothetical protein
MGMIAFLQRASDAQLRALLRTPELVHEFIEADDPHLEGPIEGKIDLDKAWHGAHFLLTGTSEEGEPPLDFLMCGGREVGDEDVGLGPARVFFSAEVEAIARGLFAIPQSTLRERFDPRRMTELEIYPAVWDREGERTINLDYVLEAIDTLTSFVAAAVEARQGLLIYYG